MTLIRVVLKETKKRVREDFLSTFSFFCSETVKPSNMQNDKLVKCFRVDHSPTRSLSLINGASYLTISSPPDTESKDAVSAITEGETKPASPPSSSPPVHCTPPLMEPRPSNTGTVVDNTQLNNSHPVQASSAPSEGMPGGFVVK